MRNAALGAIIFFLVVLLLIVIVQHGSDEEKVRIIKDAECGVLSKKNQSLCCEALHKNKQTSDCIGAWTFNRTAKICEYSCEAEEIVCATDVNECPDGSFVSRNPANGCALPDCPFIFTSP